MLQGQLFECIPIGVVDGGFNVVFNDLSFFDLDYKPGIVEVLGHEMGHTFHLDPTKPNKEQWRPPTLRIEDRIERFCNSFCLRWRDLVDQGQIENYLREALEKTNEHRVLSRPAP